MIPPFVIDSSLKSSIIDSNQRTQVQEESVAWLDIAY